MKAWKKEAGDIARQAEKLEKAESKRSQRKRPHEAVDEDDLHELCPLAKQLQQASKTIDTHGFGEAVDHYPQKPYKSDELKEAIDNIVQLPQFVTLRKWAERELKTKGEMETTVQVLNKKLLTEVGKACSKLDSKIKPGTFDLDGATDDGTAMVRDLSSYHFLHIDSDHFP